MQSLGGGPIAILVHCGSSDPGLLRLKCLQGFGKLGASPKTLAFERASTPQVCGRFSVCVAGNSGTITMSAYMDNSTGRDFVRVGKICRSPRSF